MKFKDLTGMKFGSLLVEGIAPKTKNRSIRWFCVCDCGKKIVERNVNLIDGIKTDCGCKTKKNNILGLKFFRLTVVEKVTINNKTFFKCKCDCGKIIVCSKYNLLNGISKSCGCLAQEIRKKGNPTHGYYNTRIYKIYLSMKNRCYCKSCESYKNYGYRGIKICDEWLGENGLNNFYNWAINNGYQDSLSIDRIDNDGNYEPSNCRWATMQQQQSNTRKNKWFEYNGEKLTLSQISRKYNIDISTLSHRLKKFDYDIQKSIETPINLSMSRAKRGGD